MSTEAFSYSECRDSYDFHIIPSEVGGYVVEVVHVNCMESSYPLRRKFGPLTLDEAEFLLRRFREGALT